MLQGRELGQYSYKTQLENAGQGIVPMDGGSMMMVVATDAPILSRNLDRLSKRAMLGLARTGSVAHNSSGDYVISFSTNKNVRRDRGARTPVPSKTLTNSAMSPLFQAAVEAIQEAVYNAILKAKTVSSSRGILKEINIDQVKEILEKYNVTNYNKTLSPMKVHNP